jgi:SAM-dependent methyltransferase
MEDPDYVRRLIGISDKRLKRFLQPFNPYRINLRRWVSGSCLEIGCGIGRNLNYLANPENIGVELNQTAADYCNSIGHRVYTTNVFSDATNQLPKFDNLLFSHVLEHMNAEEAVRLISSYLHHLKDDGRIVIICPQMRGFISDQTHIEFMDFAKLSMITSQCSLRIERSFSHPLPRIFSRVFVYNEYVVIAKTNKSMQIL